MSQPTPEQLEARALQQSMDSWRMDRGRNPELLSPQNNPANTCYTMRVYFFKQNDGHAPKLAGTQTCVQGLPKTKQVKPGYQLYQPL